MLVHLLTPLARGDACQAKADRCKKIFDDYNLFSFVVRDWANGDLANIHVCNALLMEGSADILCRYGLVAELTGRLDSARTFKECETLLHLLCNLLEEFNDKHKLLQVTPWPKVLQRLCIYLHADHAKKSADLLFIAEKLCRIIGTEKMGPLPNSWAIPLVDVLCLVFCDRQITKKLPEKVVCKLLEERTASDAVYSKLLLQALMALEQRDRSPVKWLEILASAASVLTTCEFFRNDLGQLGKVMGELLADVTVDKNLSFSHAFLRLAQNLAVDSRIWTDNEEGFRVTTLHEYVKDLQATQIVETDAALVDFFKLYWEKVTEFPAGIPNLTTDSSSPKNSEGKGGLPIREGGTPQGASESPSAPSILPVTGKTYGLTTLSAFPHEATKDELLGVVAIRATVEAPVALPIVPVKCELMIAPKSELTGALTDVMLPEVVCPAEI